MARKIKPMSEVGTDEAGQLPPPPPPPGQQAPYPGMQQPPPGIYPPYGYLQPPQTSKPKIAGILMIVSALVIIAYSGYLMTLDSDDLADAMELSLSSSAAAEVDVSGTVYNQNSTPIQNVKLTINLEDSIISDTTDADGKFTLRDVPTGRHIIIISADNYTTINHKMYVEQKEYRNYEDYDLSFEMQEGTGAVDTGDYDSEFVQMIGMVLMICASLMIVFSILIIVAAVFVIKRKMYMFGIAGCVIGIIFGFNAFFIGTILCIIALVLIIKSKGEFQKK